MLIWRRNGLKLYERWRLSMTQSSLPEIAAMDRLH